jgi:hypothetical protein
MLLAMRASSSVSTEVATEGSVGFRLWRDVANDTGAPHLLALVARVGRHRGHSSISRSLKHRACALTGRLAFHIAIGGHFALWIDLERRVKDRPLFDYS